MFGLAGLCRVLPGKPVPPAFQLYFKISDVLLCALLFRCGFLALFLGVLVFVDYVLIFRFFRFLFLCFPFIFLSVFFSLFFGILVLNLFIFLGVSLFISINSSRG